jgi:two-component system response regulator NreC
MYKVLIADDHAVLRSGLKLLLNGHDDFTVVGEAPTGLAAITLAEELRQDLILLDLNMPGLGGLEALPIIKEKSPDSQILILTMHSETGYLRQAIEQGAAGYILKKAADTELITAMKAIMRSELYVHSSMTKGLLGNMLPEQSNEISQDRWETLSSRERQILKLVALGHTSAEVAEKLNLSPKTVGTYRARGMEKLELKTRAALVRFALKRGLLDA